MPGLQEWIHRFEEGEGVRVVKVVAAILGIIALAAIYDVRRFKNFAAPEAMDAAQLARNLSAGKGFTTDCVRPLSMFLVQKHRKDESALLKQGHPDLTNPPLYPLLLAGAMKLLPFNYLATSSQQPRPYQPDLLIGVMNQGVLILVAWLLFLLAKRLFDPVVGWLSAGLFVGTELFWRFSISGLPTLLLMGLFLGIIWGLVRLEQGAREEQHPTAWFAGWGLAIGILLGTGMLMRYSFGWLVVPVAAFLGLYLGPRRPAVLSAVLVAFVLIISPWLVRNYSLSGTFFGTAGYALFEDGYTFPGNTLERTLSVDPTSINGINLADTTRKLLANVNEILQREAPKLAGNWFSAFFLVGLLVPFRNLVLTRLRYFLLACLGVFTLVQALGRTHLTTLNPEVSSENLLVILAPLVLCYGVGMYYLLLDQLELPFVQARRWITGAAVTIACAPMLFSFLPPGTTPVSAPYMPWLVQKTSAFMQPEEMMMSDMPWAVAWYGLRQCVSLSLTPEKDFFAINDFQKPIKGLYITQLTLDERFLSKLVKGEHKAWWMFILKLTATGKVVDAFPLKYAWTAAMPYQILLADWERWGSAGK
jgi:hypothetical protein